MKLRKRDLFLLVAAPALVLGAIGTIGGVKAAAEAKMVNAATELYPLESYSYNLVTDVSALSDGDLVVIGGVTTKDAAYVMGNINKNN